MPTGGKNHETSGADRRYDQALGLEAYSLRAVDRPFPSHFHDHYVIGVVERGTRTLTCGRQRQVIGPGDVLLFNPGDSHACIQADGPWTTGD